MPMLGWLKSLLSREHRNAPAAPAPAKPNRPGNLELIEIVLSGMSNDPRDLPELNAVRDHLHALIIDRDTPRAVSILKVRKVPLDTLLRMQAALVPLQLANDLISEVPPFFAITAWLQGQGEQHPIAPDIPAPFKHGVVGFLATIMWMLRYDPRNLLFERTAQCCLEALFLDRDPEKARPIAARLPIDVLLRVDAALEYATVLYESPREATASPEPAPDPAGPGTTSPTVVGPAQQTGTAFQAVDETAAEIAFVEPGVKAQLRTGRPPKLTFLQRAEALQMRADGADNAEIARHFDVSRSTISRLLKDTQTDQ